MIPPKAPVESPVLLPVAGGAVDGVDGGVIKDVAEAPPVVAVVG